MVDIVVNHFAYAGDPTQVNYASFTPFNSQSYFHSYCPITSWDYSSNQTGVEDVRNVLLLKLVAACWLIGMQCWLGDRYSQLPDIYKCIN